MKWGEAQPPNLASMGLKSGECAGRINPSRSRAVDAKRNKMQLHLVASATVSPRPEIKGHLVQNWLRCSTQGSGPAPRWVVS